MRIHAPPAIGPPLVEELPGLTPWDVCQRLANRPHLVFFDSAVVSPQGQYSYVSADPLVWLDTSRGQIRKTRTAPFRGDPFAAVRELLGEARVENVPGLPPFQGGVAGLFGYDLAHHLEELPRPAFDDFQVPDLAVGLYDWVFAFDHASGQGWLIVTGLPATDSARRMDQARRRRDEIQRLLNQAPPA